MTKNEKTIWDLAQLYDFYQKIKKYRIKLQRKRKLPAEMKLKRKKLLITKGECHENPSFSSDSRQRRK